MKAKQGTTMTHATSTEQLRASRYQPYPKYKDSGVEWLGEMPEGWYSSKLKYYCYITDGSHYSPKISNEGKYYISVSDVKCNFIDFDNAKKILVEDYSNLEKEGCKPENGDILLTKDGTIGRACIVYENMPDFVVLSSLGIIRSLSIFNKLYLYYYLISSHNVQQMYSLIHGSALKRMTISKIKELINLLPPLKEQTQIANFLDHETQKIDTLISKQEQLIALLQEKRQALISHAVTKGLDPNAKMKDSGVAWLGEIPEGWKISKLKYYCYITDGSHYSPKTCDQGEYYISVSDVKINTIDFNNAKKISNQDYNNLEKDGCKPKNGDILLTKDGTIGRACIVNNAMPNFVILSSLGIIRSQSVFNKLYLYFYLISQHNVQQMFSMIHGSALKRMTISKIKELTNLLPPLNEQTQIADYLDTQTAKIDTLIDKAKQAIDLLQERRTALISAAVTGKIDLRNWQAPAVSNVQAAQPTTHDVKDKALSTISEPMEVCA